MKANRLNYLRVLILSTSLLLPVSVLPQVHASEATHHIPTERCEACQSSSTPKSIQNLIPEICSATMMLTGVALSTHSDSSMAIIPAVVKRNGLVKVGELIPTVGILKKVRNRDVIVVDENSKERRFPMFCTPSKKEEQVTQVQAAPTSPTRTQSAGTPIASVSSSTSRLPSSTSKIASPPQSDSTAEFAALDTGQSNIRIGTTTITHTQIEKAAIEEVSQNISKLASHARATQYLDEKGNPIGIEVSNVTDDGFYKKYLDLKNGDIIQVINETPVTSPAMMQNMVRMLKSGERLQIKVLRNGEDTVVIGAKVGK